MLLDESYAHTSLARWESQRVAAEQVAVRANSRMLFLQAVLVGAGVGLLPCGLADQEAGLRRLTEPIKELGAPLWIVVHPDVKDVPRIRAVTEFFTARILAEKELLEARG